MSLQHSWNKDSYQEGVEEEEEETVAVDVEVIISHIHSTNTPPNIFDIICWIAVHTGIGRKEIWLAELCWEEVIVDGEALGIESPASKLSS